MTENTAAAAVLPWYCVQLILDTIEELPSSPSSSFPPPSQPPLSRTDCVHRLHLMLISTLPSLPLEILERCLESVRGVLVGYSKEVVEEGGRGKDEERKKELVRTLFELLSSDGMGEGEKEVGVKWWYENLELIRAVGGEMDKGGRGEQLVLESRL